LEGGPSGFRPGFTCPNVLGYPSGSVASFVYRAITVYGVRSSVLRLDVTFVTSADVQRHREWAPRHPMHNASGLGMHRV
jgi:hypothetical protein